MKIRWMALLVAALAGSIACTTLRTSVDFDRTADFSKYRTYKWMESGGAPESSLVVKRFTAALDRQLVARGLAMADPADLLVTIQAHRERQTVYYPEAIAGWGWGYGPGWWHGNLVYWHPEEIPVGTLVVDLVDAKSNQLVWRGIARRVLDPMASIEQKERNADETAIRLFESYPPR